MDKIYIPYLIVVEGKYDKIKLSSFIDGIIITTNGFGIFKDKDKIEFIRKMAKEKGIVILTDSDNAGFMIRNYIKNCVNEGNVYNVFIPDILGKERRKAKGSKEGKLGVEGIEKNIIINAFEKAGLLSNTKLMKNKKILTKADLFFYGISGGKNSKSLQKKLLIKLELPENMSINTMLSVINYTMNYDEIINILKNII